MAKIFITEGTGSSQVLNESDSNKLKVYDSYEDIDTTELVDGEVVSTKEDAADGNNVYDYIDYRVNELIDAAKPKEWDFDFENNKRVDYGTTTANNGFHITDFVETEDTVSFKLHCGDYAHRPVKAWYRLFEYIYETYGISKTICNAYLTQSTNIGTNIYFLLGGYWTSSGWRMSKYGATEGSYMDSFNWGDIATSSGNSIGAWIGSFTFNKE